MELNVPSVPTILLIFHQSCASSAEPWSHYSLKEMASIWQARELQESLPCKKVVMATWLCNLTGKSSNWFAKIKSKQNWKRQFTCCQLGGLVRTSKQAEGSRDCFPEQALSVAITWLLAELNEMQTVKKLWISVCQVALEQLNNWEFYHYWKSHRLWSTKHVGPKLLQIPQLNSWNSDL